MRKQILLAACLAALALIAGVFYAARTVLSHSFASIEADEARQSTERVRQALQADLHQLDVAAEDNALWDDLYEFVQGGRPDFLEHSFSRRSLDNIHVDVVWVFDNAGRTVIQLAVDHGPAGGVKPLGAGHPGELAELCLITGRAGWPYGPNTATPARARWGDGGCSTARVPQLSPG